MGEAGEKGFAGLPGVDLDAAGGALRIAGGDRRGNGFVLVPQRFAWPGRLQHRAHDTTQMDPLQLRAAADERVARCGEMALWKAMSVSIIALM